MAGTVIKYRSTEAARNAANAISNLVANGGLVGVTGLGRRANQSQRNVAGYKPSDTFYVSCTGGVIKVYDVMNPDSQVAGIVYAYNNQINVAPYTYTVPENITTGYVYLLCMYANSAEIRFSTTEIKNYGLNNVLLLATYNNGEIISYRSGRNPVCMGTEYTGDFHIEPYGESSVKISGGSTDLGYISDTTIIISSTLKKWYAVATYHKNTASYSLRISDTYTYSETSSGIHEPFICLYSISNANISMEFSGSVVFGDRFYV